MHLTFMEPATLDVCEDSLATLGAATIRADAREWERRRTGWTEPVVARVDAAVASTGRVPVVLELVGDGGLVQTRQYSFLLQHVRPQDIYGRHPLSCYVVAIVAGLGEQLDIVLIEDQGVGGRLVHNPPVATIACVTLVDETKCELVPLALARCLQGPRTVNRLGSSSGGMRRVR